MADLLCLVDLLMGVSIEGLCHNWILKFVIFALKIWYVINFGILKINKKINYKLI